MEKIIHFGVEFRESKYGYKMNRKNFMPTLTESMRVLYKSKREINNNFNK